MLIWFIAGQVTVTLGLLIACAAVEAIRPVHRHFARTVRFNVVYAGFMVVWAIVLQPWADLSLQWLHRRIGNAPVPLPEHGWPVLFSAIVLMIASDFLFYWYHRAQHASARLWAMHSFHHSDDDVNAGTAYRHYWLERPLWLLLSTIPLAMVFRISGETAVAYLAVFQFFAVFPHLNSRVELGALSTVFLGPQVHRIHHSVDPEHFNTNFCGAFPIWDLLFGTYRPPKPGEFPPTGVLDRSATPGPAEVVLWPVAARAASGSNATTTVSRAV